MMGIKLLEPEEIVRLLREGPDRINVAAEGLSNGELGQRPVPEAWSPNEILAHLRACQDVWGDIRVMRMLSEVHPTVRAINPRTWLEETTYRDLPFRTSLAAFAEQRQRFLATISQLSPDQWLRDGTFTGGGKARKYTVHTEADALARHERSHVRQIERLCRVA